MLKLNGHGVKHKLAERKSIPSFIQGLMPVFISGEDSSKYLSADN